MAINFIARNQFRGWVSAMTCSRLAQWLVYFRVDSFLPLEPGKVSEPTSLKACGKMFCEQFGLIGGWWVWSMSRSDSGGRLQVQGARWSPT
ncbi:MAG: hypothetical protein AAGF71_11535 [Pseudomonadota bacterium]